MKRPLRHLHSGRTARVRESPCDCAGRGVDRTNRHRQAARARAPGAPARDRAAARGARGSRAGGGCFADGQRAGGSEPPRAGCGGRVPDRDRGARGDGGAGNRGGGRSAGGRSRTEGRRLGRGPAGACHGARRPARGTRRHAGPGGTRMIIEMVRLRIFGPRDRLGDVFDALQDLGVMHLAEPGAPAPGVSPVELTPAQRREQRQLRRALDHVERALTALGLRGGAATRAAPRATRSDFARWARLGWRVRRATDRLAAREAALEEERALILKYQQFFGAFRALLESKARWPSATAYHVLIRGGESEALIRLRGSLRELIGDA